MRLIVEVREMGPHAKKALQDVGRIAGETAGHKTYVLDIAANGNPERKRICAERVIQRIGELGFVTNILLPGYRSLRPERWD